MDVIGSEIHCRLWSEICPYTMGTVAIGKMISVPAFRVRIFRDQSEFFFCTSTKQPSGLESDSESEFTSPAISMTHYIIIFAIGDITDLDFSVENFVRLLCS